MRKLLIFLLALFISTSLYARDPGIRDAFRTELAHLRYDIVPYIDNTIDLGSSTYEFKDLYIDGTAYIDTLSTSGTATFDRVEVGGGYGSTGSTLYSNGNISADGALTVETSQTLYGDLNMRGNDIRIIGYLLGDAAAIRIGNDATADTVSDSDDLFCSDQLEVENETYLKGDLQMSDSNSDTATFSLSDDGDGNLTIVTNDGWVSIGDDASANRIADAGDFYVQDDVEIDGTTDCDGAIIARGGLTMADDVEINWGDAADIKQYWDDSQSSLAFDEDENSGAQTRLAFAHSLQTGVSGASVTVSLIPQGCWVLGVTTRVTSALGTTNGTTGYQIGDGSDVDRWGDITGTASGTTSDNGDATADPTGSFTAGNDVELTAVGGNFDGTGNIRIVVHFFDVTAPTK